MDGHDMPCSYGGDASKLQRNQYISRMISGRFA